MSIYAPYGVIAAGRYRFLIDEVSGAYFAFGLKRLSLSYAGSCLQVRRSSDNATQDIGFKGNFLDVPALLSFVGANDGFISIWYDQTGSSRNATQTSASSQPKIVSAGSYLGEVTFDGSNDFFNVAATAVLQNVTHGAAFMTVKAADTSSIGTPLFIGVNAVGSTGRFRLDVNAVANRYRVTGRRLDNDTTAVATSNTDHNATERVISEFIDYGDSDAFLYENGTNTVSNTSFLTNGSTSNTASGQVRIGSNGNQVTDLFKGTIKNLIVYNTEKSGSRTTAEEILNKLK